MTKIGADMVQRMIEGVPQLAALGMKFVALEDGAAVVALPYSEKLVGFPETGVIAGGAIYTLMDSASGMAVFARMGEYRPIATLDLRIDYLKPATPEKTVYGRAQCYKLTRRVAFVRGTAYHDDPDRPVAHTTGTFMLSEPKS